MIFTNKVRIKGGISFNGYRSDGRSERSREKVNMIKTYCGKFLRIKKVLRKIQPNKNRWWESQ